MMDPPRDLTRGLFLISDLIYLMCKNTAVGPCSVLHQLNKSPNVVFWFLFVLVWTKIWKSPVYVHKWTKGGIMPPQEMKNMYSASSVFGYLFPDSHSKV